MSEKTEKVEQLKQDVREAVKTGDDKTLITVLAFSVRKLVNQVASLEERLAEVEEELVERKTSAE